MEKVRVKSGFKEVIETMQAKGETLYQIIQHHATGDLIRVNRFPIVEAMSGDQLIRALYCGYEVIEEPQVITITPEQKLWAIEYYKTLDLINFDAADFAIRKIFTLIGIEWEEIQ